VGLDGLGPAAFIARQRAFGFDLILAPDGRIGIKGSQPPASIPAYIQTHRSGIIALLEAEAESIRAELRSFLEAGRCEALPADTREALAAIARGEGPDNPYMVRGLLDYLREAEYAPR